jgi:hypothetical protein
MEHSDHDLESESVTEKKPNLIARFITWRDSLVKTDDVADAIKCPSVQLQSLEQSPQPQSMDQTKFLWSLRSKVF